MQERLKRSSWLSALGRLGLRRGDRGAVRTLVAAAVLALAAGAIAFLFTEPFHSLADPATFTVTSTGDGGDSYLPDDVCGDGLGYCTLRAAIEQANYTGGTDTISFNIAGGGTHTIQPLSALPIITEPVIIDGYTQPGASANTNPPTAGSNAALKIELDGLDAGINADGLRITAGGSTVKGLAIGRFSESGISLENNGGNSIEGSFLGTDASGTLDRGNGLYGVIMHGSNNTIGGTAAGARNVISANASYGVVITGVSYTATLNVVLGNLIGTDATGTVALANGGGGVVIDNGYDNTIGGTTAEARNVVSGNYGFGVEIEAASTGNLVEGNLIGLQVDGTSALGNADDGVSVGAVFGLSASNNVIGGVAAGAGNTIAYNSGDGVRVAQAGSTGNSIHRNSIYSNNDKGIENIDGGNTELAPPIIDSTGSASGHTSPVCYPCTVEVFSDNEDEGRVYHGSTSTIANGTWTYSGAVTGPNVTATVTDASGNTSEFSTPVALSPTATVTPTAAPTVIPTPTPTPAGGVADIRVTKTDSADPVDHGQTFTYTVVATNFGPDAARGLTIFDFLPDPTEDPSRGDKDFVSATVGIDTDGDTVPDTIDTNGDTVPDTTEFPCIPGPIDPIINVYPPPDQFNSSIGCGISPTLVDSLPVGQSAIVTITVSVPLGDIGTENINIASAAFVTDWGEPNPSGDPDLDNEADCDAITPYQSNLGCETTAVTLPPPLVVNSTADPGDGTCDGTECTLREAITAANADPGADTIEFDIVGEGGPYTITPTSGLPIITDTVTIDGTTQPDYTGTPIIELSGASATDAVGLNVQADNTTIRGLVINGFAGYCGLPCAGIALGAAGAHVEGNYIGTDASGTGALPNGAGVFVWGVGNTIGGTTVGAGNVISANDYGVVIASPTGNQVLGNLIGTDAGGDDALLGNDVGVYIAGPGNTVGGTVAGAGNTIAYSTNAGVQVHGEDSTANTIRSNSIYSNGVGIDNESGGNGELAPPVITSASPGGRGPITGTACAGCYVEVFSDDGDQGRVVLGHTFADGGGAWTLLRSAIGPYVTATATNAGGSTSEFSDPYEVVNERRLQYSSQADVTLESTEQGEAADLHLDVRVPPSSLTTDSVRLLMSGHDWFPADPDRRPATEIVVGDAIVELDAGNGHLITVSGGGAPDVPIPLYAVADGDFAGTLGQLPADIDPYDVLGAFKAKGSDLHIWYEGEDITDSLDFDGTGYAWIVDRGGGKTELVLGTEGYASIATSVRVSRVELTLKGQVGDDVIRRNAAGEGYYPLVARAASADNPYGGPAGGRGRELALGMECLYIGSGTPPTDADGDCLAVGDDPDDGIPDLDLEGLPDGYDLLCGTAETVNAADLDGDFVDDWVECARGTGPDPEHSPDTDGDGRMDGEDNCPATYNPSQADQDGDGQGDACDEDIDGDYLTNKQEADIVVSYVSNGDQSTVRCGFGEPLPGDALDPEDPDSDGDLVLDGAECALGSDPTDPDSTPEVCGNTPDDDDNDGLVDEVPTTLLTHFAEGCTGADDPDSDGLMNARDGGVSWENVAGTCMQVMGSDPTPPGDPDHCVDALWEANPDGDADMAPDDPDSDNDGLSDGEEFMHYGTSPVNPDSDGDGVLDGQEVTDGTNPLHSDTDLDGCSDGEEPDLGDSFDRVSGWYDVYDVPVPAGADPTPNGTRNRTVDIGDVLAVLFYAFAEEGGPPNANGVAYDTVKGSCNPDGDSVLDPEGLCYDRSPGPDPDPETTIDPAGPPNGSVDIGDVLAALAQAFVVDCSGPPD